MKKYLLLIIVFLAFAAPDSAEAQEKKPLPSPPASVYTQVGLTDVKIDYFRPRVKGRKIFGGGDDFLVPFDKIWRTGANSGSKVSFSDDVKVNGKDIKAGEYLIFTVPGKREWQVMLYSDTSIGGYTSRYENSNEVARFSVIPSKTGNKVEMLTFQIEDLSQDNTSANITMSWDDTKIEIPIKVSF